MGFTRKGDMVVVAKPPSSTRANNGVKGEVDKRLISACRDKDQAFFYDERVTQSAVRQVGNCLATRGSRMKRLPVAYCLIFVNL